MQCARRAGLKSCRKGHGGRAPSDGIEGNPSMSGAKGCRGGKGAVRSGWAGSGGRKCPAIPCPRRSGAWRFGPCSNCNAQIPPLSPGPPCSGCAARRQKPPAKAAGDPPRVGTQVRPLYAARGPPSDSARLARKGIRASPKPSASWRAAESPNGAPPTIGGKTALFGHARPATPCYGRRPGREIGGQTGRKKPDGSTCNVAEYRPGSPHVGLRP